MSIASDVRSYADTALEQGKTTYTDLRTKGEALYGRVTTLPVVEQVSSTVEPYVAQLNGYRTTVTDKVEQLYTDLKKNDQVAKALGVAEQAAGVVIETVNERVVNPVKSLLDRETVTEAKPTTAKTPTAEAAPAKATAPAKAAPAKRTTTRRAAKA